MVQWTEICKRIPQMIKIKLDLQNFSLNLQLGYYIHKHLNFDKKRKYFFVKYVAKHWKSQSLIDCGLSYIHCTVKWINRLTDRIFL